MNTPEMIKALYDNRTLKARVLPFSTTIIAVGMSYQGDRCLVDQHNRPVIIPLDAEWEIIREAVDFMTAINSGKKIRSEFWNDGFEIDAELENSAFPVTLSEINGKWYIYG